MFKDYFSDNSAQYGQYRPHYPKEVFQYLASVSPSNDKAWDCACGTGQSALGLSEHFQEVVATDASEKQIVKAIKKTGITYQVSSAEKTQIGNEEIDLITVAQALHWFDIELFFKEAGRVLKANGVLAVWTYNLLEINRNLDNIISHLYNETLREYWPPERKMVEKGYKGIVLPFTAISPPSFKMHAEWNLFQLIGYLKTWSALKKYKNENQSDELTNILKTISTFWGNPDDTKTITWPLTIIIHQKIYNK
jgi:ubiquinone/menaquinone biosynthesis C-methylase UbiE